ncbi:unnamed protein product [Cylindrotheca closterium]|uniref:Sulfotransferase domain-containing protein n=1 Tax=Cylindrotheca closterium TaxID=2856 RepID=A0AAD2FV42_9STRA|nr:unnamed protein product [Cylindrotheca closterium]
MQSMDIDSEIDEVYSTVDQSQRQSSGKRRRRRPRWITTFAGALVAVPLWVVIRPLKNWGSPVYIEEEELTLESEGSPSSHGIVLPQILMDEGIYDPADFTNAIDVAPPYWNATTPLFKHSKAWGPCFKPEETMYWEFHSDDEAIANTTLNVPLDYRRDEESKTRNWQNAAGLCRPGFLILGAGKCGTSSLYHYLVDHPKVLPAIEKQIHYFRYHTDKPVGWYYSWFPTTKTFLENGALMTGEASPGYLPYPQVVREIAMTGIEPKLITLGRKPIDRIWSSYKYNYVTPALDKIRSGHGAIPLNKSDDFYKEHFLFSLEELVRAELDQLNRCLYGFGISKTRDMWYHRHWTRKEFDYREKNGLPPLIDLDEVCYGTKPVNKTVTRIQWASLQMQNPQKYIPPKQAFLIQALVGRSLYVLPLEWWYILIHREDMLFVCTEEINNATALLHLSRQLGLPDYDFEPVIAQGAYNVGGHRGYDTATSWNEVRNETDNYSGDDGDEIPLSVELRQELDEFLKPFNERLFNLVGKRCDW